VNVIPRQRITTMLQQVLLTPSRSNSCVSCQPRSSFGSAFLRSSFPNFGSIGAQGVVSLAAQLSSRAPSHPIRFGKAHCFFPLLPSVLFRNAARIEKTWVEAIKIRHRLCGWLCVQVLLLGSLCFQVAGGCAAKWSTDVIGAHRLSVCPGTCSGI